jgi:hypothetical protein
MGRERLTADAFASACAALCSGAGLSIASQCFMDDGAYLFTFRSNPQLVIPARSSRRPHPTP